jgi:hypothetical protein
MWIRVKKDGFIYPYDEILAKNPSCEVVSEEVAFPDRAITPTVQAAIEYYTVDVTQPLPAAPAPAVVAGRRARGRPRKAPLDLSTPEVPEPPVYTSPELAQDASRGLP